MCGWVNAHALLKDSLIISSQVSMLFQSYIKGTLNSDNLNANNNKFNI